MATTAKERRIPASPSARPVGTRAYMYDADGRDRDVEVSPSCLAGLSDGSLLWADVDLDSEGSAETISECFGIDPEAVERAIRSEDRSRLETYDGFLRISVLIIAGPAESPEAVEVHCFVGRNWIVTAHRAALDLVDQFNRPMRGETSIGRLDGPAFLATLLEWQLNGYYRIIERLEHLVDELDVKLLKDEDDDADGIFRELILLRRRLTGLRRILVPHRDAFSLLSQPSSNVFMGSDSSSQFQRLYDRLERAIDSVETVREMVVGSFEVFMTQTAQRTNEVMKILTIVSVLLLPAVVVAGIMGMNFQIAFFEEPRMFWVAVGFMVFLAVITLIVARRRHWI
jgi:magnesium transporter